MMRFRLFSSRSEIVFFAIFLLLSGFAFFLGGTTAQSTGEIVFDWLMMVIVIYGTTRLASWWFRFGKRNSLVRELEKIRMAYQHTDKTTPEYPVSFGYKTRWIAVKCSDKQQLADALKLQKQEPCNWTVGIEFAYSLLSENRVWISPPVDGWCFLLGDRNILDEIILNSLSEQFGEACYFGTYRVASVAEWTRSVNGQVVRKFSIGDGTLEADEGKRTGIESGVAYMFIDIDDEEDTSKGRPQWADDENWVMSIAADWSVNPDELDDEKYKTEKQLGIAGEWISPLPG
ncbi:hypothetical protein FACS189454_07900 [Planctomycetales bacterium]|nr:hypothetical protein FACS189454_07900 [Planctomycetales bacterium]